ncbi:hypothetical protein HHK36_026678 [Tetracentron sinense]|uniref:Core Histone H2A/H2B/H3 domain-containing protein n=1 Tax=Tetracentron sinense TaxID=13715 RepID=A0A834YL29_TETSI|nr:hypothetical protein HHK36_026678 [Tetracentron sinense]
MNDRLLFSSSILCERFLVAVVRELMISVRIMIHKDDCDAHASQEDLLRKISFERTEDTWQLLGCSVSVNEGRLQDRLPHGFQLLMETRMDQQGHGQPPVMGVVGSSAQMPYGVNPYQANQMIGATPSGSVVTSAGSIQSPSQPAQLAQHQLAYQHIHQQQQQQLQQQLETFWANQYQEIEQTTDFKNHSLPLARIKKIMKADEDVRMISAEAPVIFARACEMFILELTLRSWNHTEENKRRTLQKNDIAAAITRTDIFDFLVDIVPREDLKDDVLGSIPRGGTLPVGGPAEALPYYYMPPQHSPQVVTPGMIMGKPVMDQAMFAQQPRPYMSQQMWPQPPQQQQPPTDS